MELTPNSRIPLPYLLPSDILVRSLNLPSSAIPANDRPSPTMTRITTLAEVSQSVPNPMSNSQMGGTSMPPMVFRKVGSQFLPSMSYTTMGSYVSILHNIPQLKPPAIGSGGHAGYVSIGPASQPPTSTWVPPQQPNIGNQYLSGEQYNNLLYVPYPRGVTNQWTQPTYRPQDGLKQGQPLFMGQSAPNYQ